MKDITYEKIIQVWGGSYKRIDYKDRWISITARKRAKDNRVVYLGEFCSKDYKRSKSIESIHYDKVISKFEKYVDEYCTDWRLFSSFPYKGYKLWIQQEYDKENFFGTCEIHKNSTFKYINNSIEKVIEKFKARIDEILNYKAMTNPKEEKIKLLEAEIAKLQQELEKVRNEKEVLIYKGIVLEYGKEGDWLVGRIKNAPEGTEELCANHKERMKEEFEKYIDSLEKSANLYLELTDQEIYIPEKHDY